MSSTFEPVLIVAGLTLCLFGWVLYWAGLRLVGALCGALATAAIAVLIIMAGGWDRWLWPACGGAAILGAIVGVFLIKRAHYLLFFLAGAVLGLAAAWAVESANIEWVKSLIPEPYGRPVYYVVFTLVGGLLVLLANRVIVVILTAFGGTLIFSLGVPSRYAIWLFLPLFLASLLVQTGVLSALGERGAGEEE